MSVSDLQAAIVQYQYELAQKEAYAYYRLLNAYRPGYERLIAKQERLLRKMSDALNAGEQVTPVWLFQEQQYQEMIRLASNQITDYARRAASWTSSDMEDYIRLANDNAKKLAGVQGIMGTWQDMNEEAIQALVGAASGRSSPLYRLFGDIAKDYGSDITDTLVAGIVQGKHPYQMASDLRQVANIPVTRARTIARTESLRAVREASRQNYIRNAKLLEGWVWHSAQNRRTCAACWAMHGTLHPPEETMASHVNCRCAMIPITVGSTVYTEPGKVIFDRLPGDTQRDILGPGKFIDYQTGKVDLEDLVKTKRSPQWGNSIIEATRAEGRLVHASGGQPLFFRYQPEPVAQAVQAPLQLRAERARAAVLALEDEKKAAVAALNDRYQDAQLRQHHAAAQVNAWMGPRNDDWWALVDKRSAATKEMVDIRKEMRTTEEAFLNQQREALTVDQRIRVNLAVKPRSLHKYSDEWKQGADWFGRFVELPMPDVVPIQGTTDDRSYHLGGSGVFMARRENMQGTVVHELGHALEWQNSHANDQAQAFLRRRTAGEPEITMRQATGDNRYKAYEVTRVDRFINPYMGKNYGPRASEITSMGLEFFYKDPARLAREDPDYFDFIYRVVRGGSA